MLIIHPLRLLASLPSALRSNPELDPRERWAEPVWLEYMEEDPDLSLWPSPTAQTSWKALYTSAQPERMREALGAEDWPVRSR